MSNRRESIFISAAQNTRRSIVSMVRRFSRTPMVRRVSRASIYFSRSSRKSRSYLGVNQLIIEVREQFLSERYAINPTNYDQIDIEKVKSHDYTIKRFLKDENMNKELALNRLDEAMKWRKSFGVNQLDYSDFPMEMFTTGAVFIYNEDYEDRPVIYLRAKAIFKFIEIEEIVKKLLILMITQLDEMADEKGVVIFLDGTDSGLKNADLNLSRFVINVGRNHFPGLIKLMLCYNLPFIAGKIMSVLKHIVGSKYSKIFKTINKTEEIFEFIDDDKVPKYLGGNCEQDFTKPPPNCTLTARELAPKYSIDPKVVTKFMTLYEPIINASKLLVNGK